MNILIIKKTTYRCYFILLVLFFSSAAHAEPIPFKNVNLNVEANSRPIGQVLAELFAQQNTPVIISDELRSSSIKLNGPFKGQPRRIYDDIASTNPILSYYDGAAVHVYLTSERRSQDFPMREGAVSKFKQTFALMRLGDSQNTLDAPPGTGIVSVSGSPRFLERVMTLVTSVGFHEGPSPTTFKVFELKHAWASDTNMRIGNRQVVVPGVASMLQRLMNPAAVVANGRSEKAYRPAAARMRGQGLAAFGDPNDAEQRDYPGAGMQGQMTGGISSELTPASTGEVQIVADTYRNAVIVRDSSERMVLYADLIKTLDIEPRLIEIEATIIDVNTAKAKNFGVNWRWRNSNNEVLFAENGVRQSFLNALLGNGNIDGLSQPPGLGIGSIIGDSYKFIARINALAEEGITSIVSRPQVVTLSNIEAVIGSTQDVFVPVGGAYEVDLFNVASGTVLRVLPLVLEEGAKDRIRMMISVEDGGVELVGPDQSTPVVTSSGIQTNAIISDGQSLLIGGLVQDKSERGENKIPVLGDVPVVGNLFKNKRKTNTHIERLFLITPRLVATNQITDQQLPSDINVKADMKVEPKISAPPMTLRR